MDELPRSLFDPDFLRRLFRQLEATDVDELEVCSDTSRLFLRREPGRRAPVAGSEPSLRRRPVEEGVPIAAPLTGVLYTRPSPEQPPFVSVGDVVDAGQIVALIETMKLFNEVVVDIAGEVISLTKEDGELVEAGQPLLYVRPDEEREE